jgi:hypothetical protein
MAEEKSTIPPAPMTPEALVEHAKKALDESLKATLTDERDRQHAVQVSGEYLAAALKEGLEGKPAGSFVKPEAAVELIKAIQQAESAKDAQKIDWDQKINGKDIAQIAGEAVQPPPAVQQTTDKQTGENAETKTDKTAEKTPPMTQEQLVDFAKSALDKSLEATIPDAAARQAAVEKAAKAFAEALSEGLKTLPKGASLSEEKAAEIISTIQKEQAQWPDWSGKVGDKPIADIVKEATQGFAKEQGVDEKTMGEKASNKASGLVNKVLVNPGKTAAAAAVAAAAAAALLPNKKEEQPDGTVKTKMSFMKKIAVSLGVVVALGGAALAVAEYKKPGTTQQVKETVGKWTQREATRAADAATKGPQQGMSA